ncbi:MAG: hypothetical protein ACLQDV_25705 [Candidatus Binataceae bacterium]
MASKTAALIVALVVVLSAFGGGSGSGIASASTLSLRGNVQSGQQPIKSSTVRLFQMGTDYGRSRQLAKAQTNAKGDWTIRGFGCKPTDAELYVTAAGGDAGSGKNHALEMMAVVGPCNSLPNFVSVNEVTTIASVWALDQFMDSSGQEIGAPATNTTGLDNAVAAVTSKNLVDVTTGLAPTSFLAGITSPTSKLYTLANIIAPCVQSNGGACSSLFAAATPTGGTPPTTTLQAALNVAHNPANNVATLFALAGTDNPFATSLGSPPHDWMLPVVSQGVCGRPAVDAQGNIWLVPTAQSQISKLSPTGALVKQVVLDLAELSGPAVDATGNLWVGNDNVDQSAVIELNPAAVPIYGTPFTPGDEKYRLGTGFLAVDGTGNMWVPDDAGTVTKINPLMSPTAVTHYPSGDFMTADLAIDRDNNVWVLSDNVVDGTNLPSITELSPAGAQIGPSLTGGVLGNNEPWLMAIDTMGNLWVTHVDPDGVTEINPSTNPPLITDHTGGGIDSGSYPLGVAVDGSNHVWVVNTNDGDLTELDPFGVPVAGSPFPLRTPTGQPDPCCPPPPPPMFSPAYLVIDAAGNIWTTPSAQGDICAVEELVGAATPVKTPLIGPPVKP